MHESALESITLPESLEAIGSNCFTQSSLRSVVIPDSVVEIGSSAFSNTKITSVGAKNSGADVELPVSLDALPVAAFCECEALTSVDLSEFKNLHTIGMEAFYLCKQLTSLKLPYYDGWEFRELEFVQAIESSTLEDPQQAAELLRTSDVRMQRVAA